MSKQEKLAALIAKVRQYTKRHEYPNDYGMQLQEAYREYEATPDDPPPRPEMPECVAELCNIAYDAESFHLDRRRAVQLVLDHYAQPLKLEVGKCYEDAGGNVIDVVWHDPKVDSHFVGVVRLTGDPRRYSKEGSCCDPNREGIIREVKK